MKVYARARKPDGGVVRVTLSEDQQLMTEPSHRAARPEPSSLGGEPFIPSWWDRWWLLRVMQQTGYQRLF